jgi:hypothetical protein
VPVRHELSSFPQGVPEDHPKYVRPDENGSSASLVAATPVAQALMWSGVYRLSPATASARVAAESLVRGEN